MSICSKPSEGLSTLQFVKKKALEESDPCWSANNNNETSKLTNRSNVKDNLTKKVITDDNIKSAITYAPSETNNFVSMKHLTENPVQIQHG